MAVHIVVPSARIALSPVEWPGSSGYQRFEAVGESDGSTHMAFSICRLEAGGKVGTHLHSFEESYFVLDGTAILDTRHGSFQVTEGDYGLIPVGVEHAWRNLSEQPFRWAEMQAPLPRSDHGEDTFFPSPLTPRSIEPVDPRDPRNRDHGHIDPEGMMVENQNQDRLKVSASMRTALLVYSGITVRMMVDSDLGAVLSTMFMVQYQPGGFAGAHDHPLEEAYLILEGEVDAVFDGHRYHLSPGDIAWAGVGCVHEFANNSQGIVRWLETQAPQPPARHSYRFARDWNYLADRLAE